MEINLRVDWETNVNEDIESLAVRKEKGDCSDYGVHGGIGVLVAFLHSIEYLNVLVVRRKWKIWGFPRICLKTSEYKHFS